MILKSSLQSDYTMTATSWGTPISGLSITIPEDGYYLITGVIDTYIADGSGGNSALRVKLAINGTRLYASGGSLGLSNVAANTSSISTIPILKTEYLRSGDVITVQAYIGAADGSTIYASGANTATYIEAINLTKLARGGM